jgi:hypothetical protein
LIGGFGKQIVLRGNYVLIVNHRITKMNQEICKISKRLKSVPVVLASPNRYSRCMAVAFLFVIQTNTAFSDSCAEYLQSFNRHNDDLSRITAKMESMKVSELSEELIRAGQTSMVALYAVSGSILDNNCLSGSQRNEMIMINQALKERLR